MCSHARVKDAMTTALPWMPDLMPSLDTCIFVGAVRQYTYASQSVLTCADYMFGTCCINLCCTAFVMCTLAGPLSVGLHTSGLVHDQCHILTSMKGL